MNPCFSYEESAMCPGKPKEGIFFASEKFLSDCIGGAAFYVCMYVKIRTDCFI